MIICEICDKGWHTYCLEPIMTTIPKDGWSCNNCRSCIDCGNRIRSGRNTQPTNATSPNDKDLLCKDCQRHRSKGDCIMCGKDTTMATDEDTPIVKCIKCAFNVHEDCELDKSAYDDHSSYQCPNCRLSSSCYDDYTGLKDITRKGRIRKGSEDSSRSDSVFTDEASIRESSDSDFTKSTIEHIFNDVHDSPRRSPARTPSRVSATQSTPPPPTEHSEKAGVTLKPTTTASKKPSSKNSKAAKVTTCSRKGSKIKSKDTSTSSPGTPAPTKRSKRKLIDINKNVDSSEGDVTNQRDESFDSFRCLIVASGNDDDFDRFTRESDVCAACASIGDANHFESKMIFCANCAQSYHIYCSGITKLTKTVIEKGWLCHNCECCELCDNSIELGDGSKSMKCTECAKTFHTGCLSAIPVSNNTQNPLKGNF